MRFLTAAQRADRGRDSADVRLAIVTRRGKEETESYPQPIEDDRAPAPESAPARRFWTPGEVLESGGGKEDGGTER